MVLETKRDIENRVYTSTIYISEFGNAELSADEEIENLKDVPQLLRYSDIRFVANMYVDEEHLPHFAEEEAEEGTYDVVRLNLTNKEVLLDPNFKISYSVDAKNLKSYIATRHSIQDADCLARAMVYLWEEKIKARVAELLAESRKHLDNFTTNVEEIVL